MSVQHHTVRLAVADSLVPQAWLSQFTSWLEVAPRGVTVEWGERPSPQLASEYLTVDDFTKVVRDVLKVPQRRVPYNARMVFFWLIENMAHKLVVLCTLCEQRRGKCECPSRLRKHKTEHNLYGPLSPDEPGHQKDWKITRASFAHLTEAVLQQIDHRSRIRRERVIQAVRYINGG